MIIFEQIKYLNEYLAECVQNNHKCAHCGYNHDGICFFAADCFRDNQKFYWEDE